MLVAMQNVVGHKCNEAIRRHMILFEVDLDVGTTLNTHYENRHFDNYRSIVDGYTFDVVENENIFVDLVGID